MATIPGPRAVAVTLTGLILVGITAWYILILLRDPPPPPPRCDPGLQEEGPECVGVSDVSDFGDPLLADVMTKIAAANSKVTGAHYSIGYLVPLEPPEARTSFSAELRHELQGVYLAQVRTNESAEIEGGGFPVQVFVGNAGVENEHWSAVVPKFQEMTDGPDRLRAVAGLGNSLESTQEAIEALTGPSPGTPPIAVVGSRATADTLSRDPSDRFVDGFFRVTPTNTDEAVAASSYMRKNGSVQPLLIRDTKTDDVYSRTLGEAFRTAFLPMREKTYDSSKDAVRGAFGSITRDICDNPPDSIYFAGRGEALADLVDVLSNRSCQDSPITIFTGDDIAGVRDRAQNGDVGVRAALATNVKVFYTGLAHPGMWGTNESRSSYSAAALAYFEDTDCCFARLFPNDRLDDGAAIMGHDALVLAVTGIRRAGELNSSGGAAEVSTSAVIQLLYQVQGVDAIRAASGEISMSACGDAEGKLFPLLSLAADGSSSLVDQIRAGAPLAC